VSTLTQYTSELSSVEYFAAVRSRSISGLMPSAARTWIRPLSNGQWQTSWQMNSLVSHSTYLHASCAISTLSLPSPPLCNTILQSLLTASFCLPLQEKRRAIFFSACAGSLSSSEAAAPPPLPPLLQQLAGRSRKEAVLTA
jgi:hypothetical protein